MDVDAILEEVEEV